MTNQLNLNDYKQQIADFYNRRSETYDNSEWHVQICQRLLEYAKITSGQYILDIATGTGHIAIAASQIVGSEGKVVGIDISAGMLEQTKQKVEKLGLRNIEFQLADAELLNFPENSFNRILCANSFPWIENKQVALQQWMISLKPGGIIAIHTPADTADIGYVVLRSVLSKYLIV